MDDTQMALTCTRSYQICFSFFCVAQMKIQFYDWQGYSDRIYSLPSNTWQTRRLITCDFLIECDDIKFWILICENYFNFLLAWRYCWYLFLHRYYIARLIWFPDAPAVQLFDRVSSDLAFWASCSWLALLFAFFLTVVALLRSHGEDDWLLKRNMHPIELFRLLFWSALDSTNIIWRRPCLPSGHQKL